MTSKHKLRTKQVETYCAKYGKDLSERDFDSLSSRVIVLEKHKLVYCAIPKVATSVWKRILAKAVNVTLTKSVHREIKDKVTYLGHFSSTKRKAILKKYKKFMFVRDPFERLLSAYRDCFWGEWKRKDPGWKNYRFKIREVLMEKAGLQIQRDADNTTFEEFVTFLYLKQNDGSEYNGHWHQQFSHCLPCQVQYDYIGHYETLQDDALFILRKFKLQDKVVFPKWHPTNTRALLHEYYSKLSAPKLSQLQKVYKEDFEAFGYTIPNF